MAGDLSGSLIKRRLEIQQGAQHEFFDQLLFLGGALAAASPIIVLQATEIAFLILVTYLIHKATNVIAHKLKLKAVPW
jgi:CDP-2,3-bis-(O-geranylgeranyl)-sn-glycerol synthase